MEKSREKMDRLVAGVGPCKSPKQDPLPLGEYYRCVQRDTLQTQRAVNRSNQVLDPSFPLCTHADDKSQMLGEVRWVEALREIGFVEQTDHPAADEKVSNKRRKLVGGLARIQN